MKHYKKSGELHMATALIYQHRINDHEKALIEFEQALIYFPNNGIIHEGMGKSYEALNNIKIALVEYKKAIECDASLAKNILPRRIQLLYKFNRYKEALEDCDKVQY